MRLSPVKVSTPNLQTNETDSESITDPHHSRPLSSPHPSPSPSSRRHHRRLSPPPSTIAAGHNRRPASDPRPSASPSLRRHHRRPSPSPSNIAAHLRRPSPSPSTFTTKNKIVLLSIAQEDLGHSPLFDQELGNWRTLWLDFFSKSQDLQLQLCKVDKGFIYREEAGEKFASLIISSSPSTTMAPIDHRDWSSLPPELLEQIATSIEIQSDYIRFRAVCNPWRSSTPANPTHFPCQLPWLLFPPGGDEGSSTNPQGGDDSSSTTNSRRCFILQVDSYKHRYLRLSEPLHRRCLGSSHGWLFFLDRSLSGVIFNPLTGAKLSLPPLTGAQLRSFDEEVLAWMQYYNPHPRKEERKFLLSDSPYQNPDFSALAIVNRNGVLACCKSGQDSWKLIPGISTYIDDATYFRGMVYVVHGNGDITICDVSGDSPEVVEKMQLSGIAYDNHTYYLVPAGDELLLVTRLVFVMSSYPTWEFKVYRLNSLERIWERVHNLGNVALFIGGNSCSSAPMASDFPGCKVNSIYFTGDEFDDKFNHSRVRHNIGIFSLEDGRFQRLPGSLRPWPAHPIWLTPNPF